MRCAPELFLETERLRLIAADASLIRLELHDRPALFATLGAESPVDWPPPLNDDASFGYFLGALESDPSFAGWGYWYVIEKRSNQPIGICGFKGMPDKAATVEIGYSIIPARQRHGFATECIAALIEWCGKLGARVVIGETLAELTESIRVMEKNGFSFDGEGSEPGVVRYRRRLT